MFRIFLTLVLLLLAPLALAGSIDINVASVSELDALPGIGPSKAQAIVTYRTDHGPFATVDDLDDVPGIGPATLEGLRDQVSVGGGPVISTSAQITTEATTDTTAPAGQPVSSQPPPTGAAVNINTATETQLLSLQGVGATKAAAIIADRTANGPYTSCDQLVRVTGIGPATVASIGSRCSVE